MFEWKTQIAKLAYVKQQLAEVDTQKLWPWHLPNIAATKQEITDCERYLGFKIDSQYADFLMHANGWHGFIQATDLFGTTDLAGGERMRKAVEILSYLEENVIKQAGVERDEVLPIALSPLDLDLFVITKPSTTQPGTVIWFAGYEIQRFADFQNFFLAMIDYNLLAIKELKRASE